VVNIFEMRFPGVEGTKPIEKPETLEELLCKPWSLETETEIFNLVKENNVPLKMVKEVEEIAGMKFEVITLVIVGTEHWITTFDTFEETRNFVMEHELKVIA